MRELFREFVLGRREELKRAERDVALAWTTAALTGRAWAGKLPKLKELLRKVQPQGESQTERQSVFYQIAAMCGKPVGKTRLIRKDA